MVGKALFKLIGASAFGQIVGLALSPLITKLYGPLILGTYGQYLSYVAIAATIIGGRFDLALIETKRSSTKIGLLQLSITISCAFLLISLIFIAASNFESVFFFIPILSFLTNLVVLYNTYLNSEEKYGQMAINKVVQAIFPNMIFLLAFFFESLVSSVFLLLGYLITLVYIGYPLMLVDLWTKGLAKIRYYKLLLFRYFRYPLYLLPSTLLSELTGNLPILMVTIYFDFKLAGFLFLANKIISIPSVFIANSISEVYREAASSRFNIYGECSTIFMHYIKRLIILSLLSLFALLTSIDYIVEYVYGIEWVYTASILKVFSIMMAGQIISSPLSYTIVFKNYHKFDLILQISRLVFASICLYLFWSSGQFLEGLLAYCVVYLFYYLSHTCLQYKSSLG